MTPDRLDELIQLLLDERLSVTEGDELSGLLDGSREYRDRYRQAMALHATLLLRVQSDQSEQVATEAGSEPIVIPLPRKIRWGWVAAIVIGLLTVVGWQMMHRPIATIVRLTESGVWKVGQRLKGGEVVELKEGMIELNFPSGAEVVLDAPCSFKLDRREAIMVLHGRLSVHAPPGAQGFVVDTPGGRFIDLGTRFGLAVGSDGQQPVVLTEVYEGEVQVPSVSGKPRLKRGESRALVTSSGNPELLHLLDSDPIRVPVASFSAPISKDAIRNLALGKPVSSPGYCIRPHGSVFPPENLTDGRLDDRGVPGDWSFWLAPDGENGEATVDLLDKYSVGRVSLQNTNNRGINDRGASSFEVWLSADGMTFDRMAEGLLPRLEPSDVGSFPFHDVSFPSQVARYVKIVITGHYRSPSRPVTHPHHSGGLNEIRVFAE